MKTSDHPHIYITASTFHFNALYNANKDFPIPRIYYFETHNLFELKGIYEKIGFSVSKLPIYCDEKFDKLFSKNYETIVGEFNDSWKKKDAEFNTLFESRKLATNISQGIRLASDKCIICGSSDVEFVTSTIGDQKALFVGLPLCRTCSGKAVKSGIIDFIAESKEFPFRLKTEELMEEEILGIGKSVMELVLNAKIEKVDSVKKEVHGLRRSGFKIIFRMKNPNDYGYIIFNPKNQEVARFDSAHHHNINFGPDHFHSDPENNKKLVTPSFLYGLPSIDDKSIIKIIEDEERKYIVKN
ncbi:MAG: DUF6516 family protein [Deltaproteobacteria bacterium]|nr:DUF6516 family protein [Deltaproteobacteria bacterium]